MTTTRKGLLSGVTNELSLFFKVLPGRAAALREGCKAGEKDERRITAFRKIATLTETRIVLFDDDTRVGFFTVYEGDWDHYIEAFLPEVIPALHGIFQSNVEDWPTRPFAEITIEEFKAVIDAHQVTAASFIWMHGEHTLKDLWKAQRIQRAFESVLDSSEGQQALAHPALKALLDEAAD